MSIAKPLRSLGSYQEPSCNLRVSIVICTKNRPDDLTRCLLSLSKLTAPPLEIIVIDNDPDSGLARPVTDKFVDVAYFAESRPGLSAARNRGLRESSGEVVAFVDDDVTVHMQFAERLRAAFRDDRTMLVTGLVLPAELETESQIIFETYLRYFHQGYRVRIFDSSYFKELRDKGVPTWSIGAGANMAIRRRAFEIGYAFDERFGPGAFGGCGEDSEFWYRLLADGWTCFYDPAVVVYHYHRRELYQLRRLVREYMKGHVAALISQYRRYGHTGNLTRLAIDLPRYYGVVLSLLIVKGFPKEESIVLAGIPGAISGLRFAFRSRQ